MFLPFVFELSFSFLCNPSELKHPIVIAFTFPFLSHSALSFLLVIILAQQYLTTVSQSIINECFVFICSITLPTKLREVNYLAVF